MNEEPTSTYCVYKKSIPSPYKEWTTLLDRGSTILSVAQEHGVTEPFVRKKLGLYNPCISDENLRRLKHEHTIRIITQEIYELYEPKFITPDHTSGFIEALITMSDSRKILELGMYSGYTTLHMIRAILGKEGGKVVSIDFRPAHDKEFFDQPDISPWFEFIQERTPECLSNIKYVFDLVFVDSDHSVQHTEMELEALRSITRPGSIIVFHDAPIKQYGRNDPTPGIIHEWLESKVSQGVLKGLILPTAPQDDVTQVHGIDDPSIRPNLGVFMRT